MTDVSSVTTGYFPTAQQGFTTTTSGTVASGAVTVGLNSVAGYTNGEYLTLVIDPTDATKKQVFTGLIDTSGVQITGVKWTEGTNQTHTAGATVVDYETATAWALQRKGWKVEHNENGTHGAITPTSVTSAGAVQGSSVVSTGDLQIRSTSVETIQAEDAFDFIASGGIWSGDSYGSTLAASMTAVVAYINGRRGTISAVTARAFTASKDTYVDILNTAGVFSLVYTEVANNAASPALAANSIRLAIIVSGGSSIAAVGSVNQGQESKVLPIASSIAYSVTDSLGNLICPRDPARKTLGYKQIVTNFSTASASQVQVTGLSVPIIVPAGRKIEVDFFVDWASASAVTVAQTQIWSGVVTSGTLVAESRLKLVDSADQKFHTGSITFTPSTTSLTVNLGTQSSAATLTLNAAATTPAFLRVRLA